MLIRRIHGKRILVNTIDDNYGNDTKEIKQVVSKQEFKEEILKLKVEFKIEMQQLKQEIINIIKENK